MRVNFLKHPRKKSCLWKNISLSMEIKNLGQDFLKTHGDFKKRCWKFFQNSRKKKKRPTEGTKNERGADLEFIA